MIEINNACEIKPVSPLLAVNNIEVMYDSVILALKGMALQLPDQGIVALLGGNGAGKSTTLKAISGMLASEQGQITHGNIQFKGKDITGKSPFELVRDGLIQVLEGRFVFPQLTVEENLLVPAYVRKTSRRDIAQDLERVYTYFPGLQNRRRSQAGYTSGGEQQMVAIGRALMARPTVILLDEPSMGLAPQIVEEIFEIVRTMNEKESVSFLISEQNTAIALRSAHYAYIIQNGSVVMSGTAHALRENDTVKEIYMGKSC